MRQRSDSQHQIQRLRRRDAGFYSRWCWVVAGKKPTHAGGSRHAYINADLSSGSFGGNFSGIHPIGAASHSDSGGYSRSSPHDENHPTFISKSARPV